MRRNLSLLIGIALFWGAAHSQEMPRSNATPFILSVNQTGLDIYRLLATANPDSNLLISPLSIYSAFSLLAPGAEGKTLEEILSVLHWSGTPEAMTDSVHRLLQDVLVVDANSDSVRFEYGNSLWIQEQLKLQPDYVSLMRTIGAEIVPINFIAEGGDSARRVINAWADEKTHGRIPEPLKKGVIDLSTIAVLMNALWMKMVWEESFDSTLTRVMPFFLRKGGGEFVRMMHRKARGDDASYADLDSLSLLELPVVGGEWAMRFLLPDSGLHLSTVENHLTAYQISNWSNKLNSPSSELRIFLPKYTIERDLSLKTPLTALGMTTAFCHADLAKMFVKEPHGDYVQDVLHSTFIEVGEQGFEAAAVTSIFIAVKAPVRPLEFRADHPFFFTITHRPTGLLVFCGRVMNPLEAN